MIHVVDNDDIRMFEGVLKALGTSHAQRFVKVHFAVLQRLLEKPMKDKEKRMQLSAEFEEYLERKAREIREKAMAAGLLPRSIVNGMPKSIAKGMKRGISKGMKRGWF